jgi:hypothetical protein
VAWWFSSGADEPFFGVQRLLLPGVLELRQCLDGLLGCAGDDKLPILLLKLADRDRYIMLRETDKPASTDDRVGYGSVRGDDEIVDDPDPFLSLYTRWPRICLLALQPTATSFNSSTVTPTVVEPATWAPV